jgi:hypothetical protein
MKMTIVVKNQNERFFLEAENGEKPLEGRTFASRKEAFKALKAMFPADSTWQGNLNKNGITINID